MYVNRAIENYSPEANCHSCFGFYAKYDYIQRSELHEGNRMVFEDIGRFIEKLTQLAELPANINESLHLHSVSFSMDKHSLDLSRMFVEPINKKFSSENITELNKKIAKLNIEVSNSLNQSQYLNGFQLSFQCLVYSYLANNTEAKGAAYNNLAQICVQAGCECSLVIPFYELAWEVSKHEMDNYLLSVVSAELAQFYLKEEDYEKAHQVLLPAYIVLKKIEDKLAKYRILDAWVRVILRRDGDNKEIENHMILLRDAYRSYREIGEPRRIVSSVISKLSNYFYQYRIESELSTRSRRPRPNWNIEHDVKEILEPIKLSHTEIYGVTIEFLKGTHSSNELLRCASWFDEEYELIKLIEEKNKLVDSIEKEGPLRSDYVVMTGYLPPVIDGLLVELTNGLVQKLFLLDEKHKCMSLHQVCNLQAIQRYFQLSRHEEAVNLVIDTMKTDGKFGLFLRNFELGASMGPVVSPQESSYSDNQSYQVTLHKTLDTEFENTILGELNTEIPWIALENPVDLRSEHGLPKLITDESNWLEVVAGLIDCSSVILFYISDIHAPGIKEELKILANQNAFNRTLVLINDEHTSNHVPDSFSVLLWNPLNIKTLRSLIKNIISTTQPPEKEIKIPSSNRIPSELRNNAKKLAKCYIEEALRCLKKEDYLETEKYLYWGLANAFWSEIPELRLFGFKLLAELFAYVYKDNKSAEVIYELFIQTHGLVPKELTDEPIFKKFFEEMQTLISLIQKSED